MGTKQPVYFYASAIPRRRDKSKRFWSKLNLLDASLCGFTLQHRYLSFGSLVYTDLRWKMMISAGEKQFCINKNNFLPLLQSSGVSKRR